MNTPHEAHPNRAFATTREPHRKAIPRRTAAIVLGVALLGAGCTSHTLVPAESTADGMLARQESPDGHSAYRYQAGEVPFDNHLVGPGRTDEYTHRELTIPSVGDNGQEGGMVRARYFRSELEGPRPLVIVLPIYARYTYPSKRMSTFLQKQSRGAVHVLDIQGRSFLIDWPTLMTTHDPDRFLELFREGVEREQNVIVDLRRLIDWAEQRPEIDGSRVALVGFSRGAIVAGIAATQERRLAATVLMMGGAHPHQIVARCDGKRTSKVRGNAEASFGWSTDELERRLGEIFAPVDAASFRGRVDPESVLIFEAGRDECIPESARAALREAMGTPTTYRMHYRHRTAFAAITPLGGNWLCHRTWDFLRERLGLESGQGAPLRKP